MAWRGRTLNTLSQEKTTTPLPPHTHYKMQRALLARQSCLFVTLLASAVAYTNENRPTTSTHWVRSSGGQVVPGEDLNRIPLECTEIDDDDTADYDCRMAKDVDFLVFASRWSQDTRTRLPPIPICDTAGGGASVQKDKGDDGSSMSEDSSGANEPFAVVGEAGADELLLT